MKWLLIIPLALLAVFVLFVLVVAAMELRADYDWDDPEDKYIRRGLARRNP